MISIGFGRFPPKSKFARRSSNTVNSIEHQKATCCLHFSFYLGEMGNESSAPIQYGTKLLNDINISWKKVEMDAKLPSRDGHCAAAMANKLYLFGGVRWLSDIGEAAESNEILVFDAGKHLRDRSS